MKSYKINILGTTYNIKYLSNKQDNKLLELDGYCDYTTKEIIIGIVDENNLNVKDISKHYEHVIKHELVHAFLNESGLMSSTGWADNETIVDWVANQHDKLQEAVVKTRKNIKKGGN